jgi:hypothetical protein
MGEPVAVTSDVSPPPAPMHRSGPRAMRSRAHPAAESRVERPRRLWGLLFSVVLIAAIGVLLFVMLGG